MLRLAQPLVSKLGLAQVLTTRHALLDMLDDMASTYQAFLIDSGLVANYVGVYFNPKYQTKATNK